MQQHHYEQQHCKAVFYTTGTHPRNWRWGYTHGIVETETIAVAREENALRCPYCVRTYERANDLLTHINTHGLQKIKATHYDDSAEAQPASAAITSSSLVQRHARTRPSGPHPYSGAKNNAIPGAGRISFEVAAPLTVEDANALLDRAGLQIEPGTRALICISCESCVRPASLDDHRSRQHNKAGFTEEDKVSLQALFAEGGVLTEPGDYPNLWNVPKFQALALVPKGYICDRCEYACPMKDTMDKHRLNAPHTTNVQPEDSIQRGPIQSFFKWQNRQRWFRVFEGSEGPIETDPVAMFQGQWGTVVRAPFKTTPGPRDANERDPFHRMTYWDDYLREFTELRVDAQLLVALVNVRTDEKSPLSKLKPVARKYLEQCAAIARAASMYTRSMLQEYPLQ
jgi:ferredoxin